MIDTSKYKAHKHPGKFQGCNPETEYFYERMLNGDGETLDYPDKVYTFFEVSDEEREAFGIAAPFYCVWESDDGFAMGGAIGRAVKEQAEDEAARLWDEIGEDCY